MAALNFSVDQFLGVNPSSSPPPLPPLLQPSPIINNHKRGLSVPLAQPALLRGRTSFTSALPSLNEDVHGLHPPQHRQASSSAITTISDMPTNIEYRTAYEEQPPDSRASQLSTSRGVKGFYSSWFGNTANASPISSPAKGAAANMLSAIATASKTTPDSRRASMAALGQSSSTSRSSHTLTATEVSSPSTPDLSRSVNSAQSPEFPTTPLAPLYSPEMYEGDMDTPKAPRIGMGPPPSHKRRSLLSIAVASSMAKSASTTSTIDLNSDTTWSAAPMRSASATLPLAQSLPITSRSVSLGSALPSSSTASEALLSSSLGLSSMPTAPPQRKAHRRTSSSFRGGEQIPGPLPASGEQPKPDLLHARGASSGPAPFTHSRRESMTARERLLQTLSGGRAE